MPDRSVTPARFARSRLTPIAVTITLATATAAAGAAGASGAITASSPFGNPVTNLSPASGLSGAGSPCTPSGGDRWAACNAIILAEINAAQAREHARRLTLPSDFLELTAAEQLFVWVDLERVARGVPPLVGLSPPLDDAAAKGLGGSLSFARRYGPVTIAINEQTHRYAWSGYTGSGSDIPMAGGLVFQIMYEDGWGGPGHGPFGGTLNPECNSPHSSGCWTDRDQLLGSITGTACTDCVMGAAAGKSPAGIGSAFALLIAQPATYPVPLSFTWNADVLPHLPAGYERVRARPRPSAPSTPVRTARATLRPRATRSRTAATG